MADTPPKRRPGRPPKANKPRKIPPLVIVLPRGHYEYLQYLVEVQGRLGDDLRQAARHILIRELDAMQSSGYHDKRVPRD
jgi:hypothetical protein